VPIHAFVPSTNTETEHGDAGGFGATAVTGGGGGDGDFEHPTAASTIIRRIAIHDSGPERFEQRASQHVGRATVSLRLRRREMSRRPSHCILRSQQEEPMDKDDVKKKAEEAGQKIESDAQSAGEQAKEAKSGLGEKLKEAGKKLEEAGEKVKEKLESLEGEVKKKLDK
jgi:hypothetical protein